MSVSRERKAREKERLILFLFLFFFLSFRERENSDIIAHRVSEKKKKKNYSLSWLARQHAMASSSAVPLLDSFEDFSTVTPWEK